MSYASREAELFRQDTRSKGKTFSNVEREALLKPYLPAPRTTSPSSPSRKQKPTASTHQSNTASSSTTSPSLSQLLHKRKGLGIKSLIAFVLHRLLFVLIHAAFSIYIRLRQTYHAVLDRTFSILYYHHRTPELIQRDVKSLQRLPQHLSVIVDLQASGVRDDAGPEGLSRLISDVSELAAWCTCIGIPLLSVYERTGTLKVHMASLHAEVDKTLSSYFPPATQPTIHMRAAPDNHSSYSPDPNDTKDPHSDSPNLNILLLSASDGRATLVDLTKTLAEMSQRQKLSPADISVDLVHAEIEESSCSEPDLLVIMAPAEGRRRRVSTKRRKRSKPRSGTSGSDAEGTDHEFVGGGGVCLQGYPPWQVRLTEIFYVQDNAGIGYQIFLRALHRYAKAEMRLGR